MKKTLCIEGLDCAACAAELEEELSKIEGISSASVSFVAQKIFLEYESEEALAKAADAANRFEEVKVLPDENQAAAPAGGKTSLTIEGLDCAACAAELEEELSKIKGISSVSVSFVMQKIALEYADEEALAKAIAAANNFEEVKVLADGRGNVYAKNGEEDSGAAGERIVLKIENLHCAGCAAELEEILKKHEGLSGV
ncbi:MAG: cation transporter, partial [Lachnospiraceae bacterium]